MKKLSTLIAGLGLMIGMAACTEKINIELKGSTEPVLVVDARLSTDTTQHTVFLSRSSDYYTPTSSALAVSGAEVYITDGAQRFDFSEHPDTSGLYRSNEHFCGIMGTHYTLHIEVDLNQDGQKEVYTAESDLPQMTERIDSLKTVYALGLPPFNIPDPKHPGWNILLYARDLPTKDYYMFTININGKDYDRPLSQMKWMPDDFTQGLYIAGLPLYFFPDDGDFPLHRGDTVRLEAWGVSADFYQYFRDLREVTQPSTPMFGGSPANVRGNISGGAFGFFAAYAVRHGMVVVE